MSRLSDNIRLVLVHGMARKPPQEAWLELWRTCLVESLRVEDPALGRRAAADTDLMMPAYWADAVPDHLAELPARVEALNGAVAALVQARRKHKADLHVPATGLTPAQHRNFGPHIIEALHAALVFGPAIRRSHLWELERYHKDSNVADQIRRPLEQTLRRCWDEGVQVVVLAHSLGVAVAYDVLWRFSHRPEPEFSDYRRKKVDLFASMGAPLTEPEVQQVMLSGRALAGRSAVSAAERRLAWLCNVRRWHNYRALGDIVCQHLDMEAQFFSGMRRDLRQHKAADFRDYGGLFNPYREPEGGPNPHKGFGYLVQPKLAKHLAWILRESEAG